MLQKIDDFERGDPIPPHCLVAMKEHLADKGFKGVIESGNEYASYENFQ